MTDMPEVSYAEVKTPELDYVICWKDGNVFNGSNIKSRKYIREYLFNEIRTAAIETKAEFERLESEAETLRDKVYLAGVLAVLDSRFGAILEKAGKI